MSNVYRHYKNKLYKFIGIAKHSETMEDVVVYRPLYGNPTGNLWVRPKEMFFENVTIDGKEQPRFAPEKFEFEMKNGSAAQSVWPLAQEVFKNLEKEKWIERLEKTPGALITIARCQGEIIGFKAGYPEGEKTFYSWSGAVSPQWRGLGIGAELMSRQHEHCRELGYKKVTTKTTNQWREMLQMNIRFGFHISRTTGEGEKFRIWFEKDL